MYSVRINQLDSHAHFVLFCNGAQAGKLVLRKEELVDFLWCISRLQGGFILGDTPADIKKQIRDILNGYDPDITEVFDFKLC